MQKNTTVGIITGFVLMIAFMLGIGMTQEDPFYMWFANSFYGIAFTFSFGFGVPEIISYILTFFLFALTFLLGFFIGKKLFNVSNKKTKQEIDSLK